MPSFTDATSTNGMRPSSSPKTDTYGFSASSPTLSEMRGNQDSLPLKRQIAIRREGSGHRPRRLSNHSNDESGRSIPFLQGLGSLPSAKAESSKSCIQAAYISADSLRGSPELPNLTQAHIATEKRLQNGRMTGNNIQRLTLDLSEMYPKPLVDKRVSLLSNQDPLTPRPKAPLPDSTTASSCDSEDDKQLLTPADESVLLGLTSSASPLSHDFSAQDFMPPSHTVQDGSSERVGLSFGVGSIGASADVSHLGIGLDGRRGSTSATPSPDEADDCSRKDLALAGMVPTRSFSSGVTAFSRSTLVQMGMVEGITPPTATIPATDSAPIEVSSVVSAGLEMGLGASLAATALMNSIPGATSAVSGLAEPRYLRPNDGSFDINSDLNQLNITADSQPSATTTATLQQPLNEAHDETAIAGLDKGESELSRRKTTGWIGAKSRNDPNRISRHQRADTHDLVLTPARPHLQSNHEKQQHQQNNYISVRTSPILNTQGFPTGYMFDMPLSAETSLDLNSSLEDHSSSNALASAGGSTHPGTPCFSEKTLLSPDVQPPHASNPFHRLGAHGDKNAPKDSKAWLRGRDEPIIQGVGAANGALMGLGGGGHFGPGVRDKVAKVLPHLIATAPMTGEEGETINIAEYGCLNTRSMQLMQPIISCFAHRAHADLPRKETEGPNHHDYFFNHQGASSLRTVLSGDSSMDIPCRINLCIIHEDSPQADFRPVSQTLDSSSDSYLYPHWQATHEPPLQNTIFPSFVSRPFASRIAPPSTIHLGISLMDLHWSHTPRNPAVSLATSAHAELTAFLMARAQEFKKEGVFIMAYIARSEEDKNPLPDRPKSTIDCASPTDVRYKDCNAKASPSPLYGADQDVGIDGETLSPTAQLEQKTERNRSNSSPLRTHLASPSPPGSRKPTDIWTTLTNTLAPCLQRLVSCGMLKSDVARHLLSLPMHPRTPRQTQNVLKSVKHLWKVEWSCGLGEATDLASPVNAPSLASEAEPLRLPHPAWKALQAGTLSRVAFAEHMIQLCKNLYESHFRVILREKGKLSKGAVEFVLDSLWDVLHSKIDDQEPCPIAECEMEVQLVALRRV